MQVMAEDAALLPPGDVLACVLASGWEGRDVEEGTQEGARTARGTRLDRCRPNYVGAVRLVEVTGRRRRWRSRRSSAGRRREKEREERRKRAWRHACMEEGKGKGKGDLLWRRGIQCFLWPDV